MNDAKLREALKQYGGEEMQAALYAIVNAFVNVGESLKELAKKIEDMFSKSSPAPTVTPMKPRQYGLSLIRSQRYDGRSQQCHFKLPTQKHLPYQRRNY